MHSMKCMKQKHHYVKKKKQETPETTAKCEATK